MFLVVLLYSLFASVFTIQKTTLEYSQPMFLVGSRMICAGILLISYQWLAKGEKINVSTKPMLKLLSLSFFNIYLTNILEVWGLKYLTSAKTCFLYSLSPYFAALLSYFLFKERLSQKKWLGLIIGFLGFIPILASHTTEEESFGSFFIFSWPELALIVAAFSSVYGWILLRQLVKEHHFTPMMANGCSMLLGGGMALANSPLIETWDPIPVTEYLPFVECTLLLMLISNFVAYNLYGYLLKKFSATFLSFAGFLTPVMTALFGWYFLDEMITWQFYVSAIIVFSGLLIFYQEELKADYKVATETSVAA